MSWFLFALISTLGWGAADLFYKAGAREEERYSHLHTAVWVGLVMGVSALVLLPFAETDFSAASLLKNALRYSPASLSYILSMVIGYAGMRYLELSVVSPVQNASGGLSALCMLLWMTVTGRLSGWREVFSLLDLLGTALVVLGVIALAVVEHREEVPAETVEKRFRTGALALIFPLLYCLFDTVGTAADGVILDEESGLGLGEIDVLVLYGLTFLLAGLGAWIFLWVKEKKPYNPFTRREMATNGIAACCEEFGQVFYVYAMAKSPVLAAPMISAYCIVSVVLSRVFLREKLSFSRYLCVGTVIAGILLLGIAEGLAE